MRILNRKPKGMPTGGEFANKRTSESEVQLEQPSQRHALPEKSRDELNAEAGLKVISESKSWLPTDNAEINRLRREALDKALAAASAIANRDRLGLEAKELRERINQSPSDRDALWAALADKTEAHTEARRDAGDALVVSVIAKRNLDLYVEIDELEQRGGFKVPDRSLDRIGRRGTSGGGGYVSAYTYAREHEHAEMVEEES